MSITAVHIWRWGKVIAHLNIYLGHCKCYMCCKCNHNKELVNNIIDAHWYTCSPYGKKNSPLSHFKCCINFHLILIWMKRCCFRCMSIENMHQKTPAHVMFLFFLYQYCCQMINTVMNAIQGLRVVAAYSRYTGVYQLVDIVMNNAL